MKRILSWLQNPGYNHSKSTASSIRGIDHVLRHSYRYDTYYVS